MEFTSPGRVTSGDYAYTLASRFETQFVVSTDLCIFFPIRCRDTFTFVYEPMLYLPTYVFFFPFVVVTRSLLSMNQIKTHSVSVENSKRIRLVFIVAYASPDLGTPLVAKMSRDALSPRHRFRNAPHFGRTV
jgi:hypothetical protein